MTLALREITRSELRAPDLSVTCIDGVLDRSIRFASEGPAVCSVTLALAGSGRTRIDGIEPLEIAGGMAVVFWSDGYVAGFDEIDSGAIQAVEIRLPPEHLTGAIGSISAKLKSALLIDRSDHRSGTVLVGVQLPARLIEVARDILTCPMQEKDLRQLYMRGKALEALALTIDALARMPLRALRLSARDKRAIDEARSLIETSPAEPWTIAVLAEAVGLSESKLKIGFREIVGISTRVYLRQIRIERAADMIASGEPVTEAALATGFHNLSHFSKAFRIVKGVGPRQFAGGIRRRTPS